MIRFPQSVSRAEACSAAVPATVNMLKRAGLSSAGACKPAGIQHSPEAVADALGLDLASARAHICRAAFLSP